MGGMTTVGDLPAYRAVPDGEGPWPGMVLVHEAFGVDDVMRRAADRVAAMGYLVLAPDLLSRGRRTACLLRTFRALRRGAARRSTTLQRPGPRWWQTLPAPARWVSSASASAEASHSCSLVGRAGTLSVVNYGALPDDPSALDGACPVVASYGGRDRYLSGAAQKLENALRDRGVPHDVKEYPGAGHSFLNDEDNQPWYVAPVSRVVLHAGPEPASAEDAWGRIEVFLETHLRR